MQLAELKKNAIHNILGWIVPTAIFVVITPVMIKKLGSEGFGIIAMIQIITGYMNMLNFGFSEAIIKQIAENKKHNPQKALQIMWAGFSLFSGIGFLGAIILFSLSRWLGESVLNIPPKFMGEIINALRLGSFVFFLNMIGEFYRGSALGHNRFDIPNISRIIRIALSGGFILIALHLGGSIDAVMAATLTGLILGLSVNIFWMHKVFPMHWTQGNYRIIFLELFNFSKHIFFVRVASLISNKINQFFLGTLSSIANVAFYEVPARGAEIGSVLLNRILQVFYPSLSSMDKEKEQNTIINIIFSTMSLQLLLTMPLMMMVMLEGHTVLAKWIDPDFASQSSGIITIIALAYFLSSMTNIPTIIAMSHNHPGIISKYNIIRVVITLIIVYPLVKLYGLKGAAWVLLISEIQAIFFIHEAFSRVLAINFYKRMGRVIFIHAACAALIYLGYHFWYKNTDLYHPLAVIAVGFFHGTAAIALKATSSQDNKRIVKLLTKWR